MRRKYYKPCENFCTQAARMDQIHAEKERRANIEDSLEIFERQIQIANKYSGRNDNPKPAGSNITINVTVNLK